MLCILHIIRQKYFNCVWDKIQYVPAIKKKVSISLSLNGSLDIICYCASYVRFGFFVGICVAYLLTHSVSNELQKCDSFILA